MTARILTGDCRLVLPTLPEAHYQTVVTSPPYWGLRDYQVEGQLGLEKDPREYIEQLVGIFRQVARVLRPDGTLWLNMGDCYTDGGRGADVGSTLQGTRDNQRESRGNTIREKGKPFGLGRKQLIGMPWRVAFALQDDGWVLRSDIVWRKRNPMPESATDRPTKAHEYLFLFVKQRYYYYDRHAIAERAVTAHEARWDPGTNGLGGGDRKTGKSTRRFSGVGPTSRVPSGWDDREGSSHHDNLGRYSEHRKGRAQSRLRGDDTALPAATRNARSVWEMSTAPFRGAHFATFPPELARRCILAGSSPHACQRCGASYERLTERRAAEGRGSGNVERKYRGDYGGNTHSLTRSHQGHAVPYDAATNVTMGWRHTCECVPPVVGRARVLDPFGGAGTVGLECERNGRDSDLIELSPSYSQMARERIDADAPLFTTVRPSA